MHPLLRNYPSYRFIFIIIALVILLSSTLAVVNLVHAGDPVEVPAQEPSPTPVMDQPTPLPGVPVEYNNDVLFYVNEGLGALTPAERALLISQRINNLATNPFIGEEDFFLVESSQGTDLMFGDQFILTVTDEDAAAVGMTRQEAASTAAELIRNAITKARLENNLRTRLVNFIQILVVILVLSIVLWLMNRLYRKLSLKVDQLPLETDKSDILHKSRFYRSGIWKRTAKVAINVIRIILIFFLLLLGLPLILRSFRATADLANRITQFLLQPLAGFWGWFQLNIPNFVSIGVIIVVTYLLIRLARAFFNELGTGSIQIEGFDPEWAPFTSRIIAFLLTMGAVIVIFPYIPGSDSDAFKGVSVFLGILFTLASTSAVANVVAGIIQTYTGAFSVGDVVRIGDVLGVVKEKNLLTTRVRTFKNEDVSIPNGNVLNSNVTNYTNQAEVNNLILYTTITIGYDVPWEQIHKLLIAAALETPDILKDPAPFVLQTSLNDYHVSYQLDCYTNEPVKMMPTYSALHANIQDKFNQAGVEIMSPAFTALRDGNTITIPEADRPAGYQVPGFRLEKGNLQDKN